MRPINMPRLFGCGASEQNNQRPRANLAIMQCVVRESTGGKVCRFHY